MDRIDVGVGQLKALDLGLVIAQWSAHPTLLHLGHQGYLSQARGESSSLAFGS